MIVARPRPWITKPPCASLNMAVPRASSLIAYWPFLEGGGTDVRDITANRNWAKFALGGSAPYWTAGKFGPCFYSPSTTNNGLLSVLTQTQLDVSVFSAEAWFRVDANASASGAGIISKFNSTGWIMALQVNSKNLLFYSGVGGEFEYTLTAGIWYHCVIVADGTNKKLYVNGQLQNSIIRTITPDAGANLNIGTYQSNSGAVFPGAIDLCALYNRALTPEEIWDAYNNPLGMLAPAKSIFPGPSVSSSGYSFYRTITIDHTKCGATNSTDFPVLVSGTYTYLKTVGNGGLVTNASGYDIAFYADSAGASILDFELVYYDATTGTVEFWVRVPTVSHTVDTVIYMFYANPSISTYQGNTNGTWNSGFGGVYHLPDGSTLGFADSTSNANNLSGINSPAAAAGQIDGGMLTDAAGNKYAEMPNSASLEFTTFTIDFWVKSTGGGFNPVFDPLLSKDNLSVRYWGTWVISNKLYIEFPLAGGNWSGNTSLPTATWLKATYTYDGTDVRIYLNGAIDMTPASHSFTDGNAVVAIMVGRRANQYITATFDEVRFSNVARSDDWILTEYNNESSPSTFYTVGSAVPISSGGGVGGSILGRIINLAVRIH